MAKKNRDIEKGYTNEQIVEKLRRLADCIESGKNFEIQGCGRAYLCSRPRRIYDRT